MRKRRELEDQEEREKTENYREISKRLEGYAEEEVKEAKALVASFIRAGEEIEEVFYLTFDCMKARGITDFLVT